MGEVKVIGSIKSLFCFRVEWALKLKGIVDYEYLEEDLWNKSLTLLEYNPVDKRVPVFFHNGKAIPESLVILEYIEEVWKENPMLPQDPYDRALARLLAKYGDEKVLFGSFGACKAQGEKKEKAIKFAKELLANLEKEITGKKFFNGDSVGYLDLVLGWIPFWLGVIEEVGEMRLLEADEFLCLHEWSQNFMDTPFIRERVPDREVILEHISKGIAYLRSSEANDQP